MHTVSNVIDCSSAQTENLSSCELCHARNLANRNVIAQILHMNVAEQETFTAIWSVAVID
jgi:hypothetical protein